MKIKKSELEKLIAEAVKAHGGNAKTQKVIVENVKKRLMSEVSSMKKIRYFAERIRTENNHFAAAIDEIIEKVGDNDHLGDYDIESLVDELKFYIRDLNEFCSCLENEIAEIPQQSLQ